MTTAIVGIVSFLLGMIVMDALWGWKTGTAQMLYRRIRGR
jgi:hypothetical protein